MWMIFEMDEFKDKQLDTCIDRSVDGGSSGVGDRDVTMPVSCSADIAPSGAGGVVVATTGLTGPTVAVITTSVTGGAGNFTPLGAVA